MAAACSPAGALPCCPLTVLLGWPRHRADHHAARRGPVRRRAPVQQDAAQVRGADPEVLRQAGQFRASPQQRAGHGEGLLRLPEPGHLGGLRDRLAFAHVHLRQVGAADGYAVPVPRHDHWHKVLDGDALKPIADEVAKKADVMILGYAGGGVRNLIVNKPVRNMKDLKGLKHPGHGRTGPDPDVPDHGRVAVRHRLHRNLQRDPDRRHPGRGKRSARAWSR